MAEDEEEAEVDDTLCAPGRINLAAFCLLLFFIKFSLVPDLEKVEKKID